MSIKMESPASNTMPLVVLTFVVPMCIVPEFELSAFNKNPLLEITVALLSAISLSFTFAVLMVPLGCDVVLKLVLPVSLTSNATPSVVSCPLSGLLTPPLVLKLTWGADGDTPESLAIVNRR